MKNSNNESVLINSVRFSNNRFDFRLCYNYLVNNENIESFDVYEEFMDPLLAIFDTVGVIKCDKDLRLLAFDEANNLYGVIF